MYGNVGSGKRVRVPISAARARLFQLTDLVRTADDGTIVVLEQRGGLESVAMVREARLAYLEARVSELERREANPYALAGSLASELDDDALERSLREDPAGVGEPAAQRDGARQSSSRRPPEGAMIAAVTDSHALIWYAIGTGRKLGRQARAQFARAENRQALVYVPVIVLVEVAEAIHRGAVRSDVGYRRWAEQLLGSGGFLAADLTPAIVREAESLYRFRIGAID